MFLYWLYVETKEIKEIDLEAPGKQLSPIKFSEIKLLFHKNTLTDGVVDL